MDQLNPDVLRIILFLLHESSRKSLFSFLTVNKKFYECTLPYILRNLHLKIERSFTIPRIHALLEDDAALRFTRMITISGPCWYWDHTLKPFIDQDEDAKNWELVARLVSKVVHLTDLTIRFSNFNQRFPVVGILRALHTHHPSSKLSVYNWAPIINNFDAPFSDEPTEEEQELSQSPCLVALHSEPILWDIQSYHVQKQKALRRMIWLAPHLEVISLTRLSPFDFEELDELGAMGHRKVVRTIALKHVVLDARSLRYLSEFAYTHKLTSLFDVSPSPDFLYASASGSHDGGNLFSSLKHLRFNLNPWGHIPTVLAAALNLFLSSCPGLTSLSLVIPCYQEFDPNRDQNTWPLSLIFTTILSRHGQSLNTLRLHQAEEMFVESNSRTCLSVNELRQLRGMVPHLDELEFDVDRTGDGVHEQDIYAILASIRTLQSININLDLGLVPNANNANKPPHSGSEGIYPLIQADTVRTIWDTLTKNKVGLPLQEFILKVGNDFRQSFLMRKGERDDEDGVELEIYDQINERYRYM
ncbi:hypothetical protein GG344DRAFT_77827 [Lentinula edodes]|nr:hypothetical protein GG344DRAFT_77827 [Lentinula edodes]